MFRNLITQLFASDPVQVNYFYYEDHKDEGHSQEISDLQKAFTDIVKTDLMIDEAHHQLAFYDHLFGQSPSARQHDELSLFIANKINELVVQPHEILSALPVLPASLSNVLTQLNNEQFDTDLVIKLIELEPVIAAKVIELANSTYYNQSEKEISELKAAFLLLGVNGLVEGVINGCVSKLTPQPQAYFKQYGKKIWQHSLSTGNIAKQLILASEFKAQSAQGYLIGLICNLGDMIIYQLMTDAFAHVHPDCQANSYAIKELLISQAKRLTYFIAQYWHFPPGILSILALQTKISKADMLTMVYQQNPIACFIYEANMISELLMLYDDQTINSDYLQQAASKLLFSEQAKHFLRQQITPA